MSTTAWRFSGTEGAETAVLRLEQLDTEDLIDVQDVAVIRWPQDASAPQAQEHVIDEGRKAFCFAKKLTKAGIDGSHAGGGEGRHDARGRRRWCC